MNGINEMLEPTMDKIQWWCFHWLFLCFTHTSVSFPIQCSTNEKKIEHH